jgi:hypothetical protein
LKAKEAEKDVKQKLEEAAKTLNNLREPIEYDVLFRLPIYIMVWKH